MKFFESFLEIAGSLGFLVGDNDRRRERARKERRSWGPEQDGFRLSIAANTLELKPDESLRIEVALRNSGQQNRELAVGSWLLFFPLEIVGPDGETAGFTSFGQQQMESARDSPPHSIHLQPTEVAEADIPVGALYNLKQKGVYTVRGRFQGGSAISNELKIRI